MNFSGISVLFYCSRSLYLTKVTALFGIISSQEIIHCIVQYCRTFFLALACSFANFFATLCLLILSLCRSLSRCASVKLYLETLDQPLRSFVDVANRNECFPDFSTKNRQGKMAFLSFPYGWWWGRSRDAPPPPPESGRTYGRTFARSYADVITKFSRLDGLPIFLTHGASLARFARRSSAIT